MPEVKGKKFPYTKAGKKAAKAYAEKYQYGGNVDPFSTKNPQGVPAQQAVEAMEQQNMAIPTSNAMDRSQTMPDTEQYKEGGKVKSKKVDVTDVVKDVDIMVGMDRAYKELSKEPKGSLMSAKSIFGREGALRKREIKRKKKEILKGKKK